MDLLIEVGKTARQIINPGSSVSQPSSSNQSETPESYEREISFGLLQSFGSKKLLGNFTSNDEQDVKLFEVKETGISTRLKITP